MLSSINDCHIENCMRINVEGIDLNSILLNTSYLELCKTTGPQHAWASYNSVPITFEPCACSTAKDTGLFHNVFLFDCY